MSHIVLIAFSVWVQSFALWTAGSSLTFSLTAAGAAALRLVFFKRAVIGPRLFKLLPIPVAAALIVEAWVRSTVPGNAGQMAPFSPLLLTAEIALAMQVLAYLRQSAGQPIPRSVPVLCLACLYLAFNQTVMPGERTLFLIVAIVGICCCGLLVQAMRRISPDDQVAASPLRRTFIVGVLAISSVTTWGMAAGWEAAVTNVQLVLPSWLSQAAHQVQTTRYYVLNGRLRTIMTQKQSDPQSVAVRVYSLRPPGYMRGRVFDRYRRGGWFSSTRRPGRRNRLSDKIIRYPLAVPPAGVDANQESEAVFAVHSESRGPFNRLVVHNEPERGHFYFTPVDAAFIQGEGRRIVLDENNVVHAGLSTAVPYAVYVPRRGVKESLEGDARARMLAIFEDLHPEVRAVAAEVCGDAQSPREKIAAVTKHFRSNYQYTIEPKEFPLDEEPLSYFLLNRPAAHCEFFASGAVALLRSEGVPARYVTGFVVAELEDEYGEYWLARNQNAHAWAEAYDDTLQQWVIVEATPGMEFDLSGRINEESETTENSRRNEMGEVFGVRNLAGQWERIAGVLTYVLPFLLICVGVGLLTTRVVQRLRSGDSAIDPRFSRIQKLRARLDRRLRRHKFTRERHETLHRFAERLREASVENDWLRRCADWYLQYAELMYAGATAETFTSIEELP